MIANQYEGHSDHPGIADAVVNGRLRWPCIAWCTGHHTTHWRGNKNLTADQDTHTGTNTYADFYSDTDYHRRPNPNTHTHCAP